MTGGDCVYLDVYIHCFLYLRKTSRRYIAEILPIQSINFPNCHRNHKGIKTQVRMAETVLSPSGSITIGYEIQTQHCTLWIWSIQLKFLTQIKWKSLNYEFLFKRMKLKSRIIRSKLWKVYFIFLSLKVFFIFVSVTLRKLSSFCFI